MKLMEKNEIGHCGEIEIVKNRFDHCGEIIKKFKFWEYLQPLLRHKFKFLTDNAMKLMEKEDVELFVKKYQACCYITSWLYQL